MEDLKDADFQEKVLNESLPVAVDFWAEWCAPCKMMTPVLEEISKEYEGKAKIMKMNVDENQETPQRFGITGIPTLIIFKNGEPVENLVGALPKNKIVDILDKYV